MALVTDQGWQLARIVVHDETRATAIVAAMAESTVVRLSAPPLSAYAAEIRRDWRLRTGRELDVDRLAPDVDAAFADLGGRVRTAIREGEWDWGERPPASFASWLERELAELEAVERRRARER